MQELPVVELKLWSVVDVYRFYPCSILTAIIWYSFAERELANGTISRKQFQEKAKENLKMLSEAARKSGADDVADRADAIVSKWIDANPSIDDPKIASIVTLVSELIGTVQKRLLDDLYFRIEPRHRPFYDQLLLTKEAEIAFPSSVRDAVEAGRCFALDRWTACVLHLMRALEFPVTALAKALNLSMYSPNWEQILNEAEREIRKITPATHGTNWKEDEQFYSEAALHFRFIKNAWRNYAVHGHDTYDRHEAYEILTHVRSFMDHLALRLKE